MITVKTNLKSVVLNIRGKLDAFKDPEFMRPIALAMIPEIAQRIHVDGKDSSGAGIGQYSTDYLALRKKNQRGDNRKVIISLTRQLENDYTVIAVRGGYGIGFKNEHNYDKSQWVQLTYGKKIFNMTPDERALSIGLIDDLSKQKLANG